MSCSWEQIITEKKKKKKPNSGDCFRPSLAQDSQIQRYRDSTGKAVCILAFLDQKLRGLMTLHRLKFYQICFPHSSKLLQATSGHPSLSQPSLSPPIPPSQKFVLLANKKLRLRIKIQLQAAGLNKFQSRDLLCLLECHNFKDLTCQLGKPRERWEEIARYSIRQSKTREQYCYF